MKKLFLQINLCLILQGIFSIASAQTSTWHQKANFAGSARYAPFGFSIGQFGYIGGGYNGTTVNDVWQYNPLSNSWTQKSSIPVAVRAAGSFVINGKAYVVAGLSGFSTKHNELFEYDPALNTWTQKTNFPGVARYGGAGFSVGSKGYYGIGNGGSATGPYYTDFFEYDPATDLWTQKTSFPGTSRYGVQGMASSSYGYVGCGVNESTGTFFNDWYQYNPSSNTWIAKATYPGSPRNYPAGFNLNGKVYVGTGQNNLSQFSDFYQYDELNNSWIQEASFAGGNRWTAAAFSIGNKGYLGTGYTSSVNYNDDFWEFSVDTTQHVTCLTLKPGALNGKDAVIHSGLPNLNTQPHNELGTSAWTCSGSPCYARSLFEFDLSSIPSNATIIDAWLDLHASLNPTIATAATTGSNNASYLQRITSPWVENSVTWNNQPSTSTLNKVTLPQSTSTSQNYLNINVTNLIRDMKDNGNYGFLIKLANETYYNAMVFTSSDDPDTSRHPSLRVCYTYCTSPGKPGAITTTGGNTKVCPGDSKTYSIAAVTGATSYLWTPPPGGVIVSGQGTVSATINYTNNFVATDSLKVAAIYGCGTGVYRAIKITRGNIPSQPSVISGAANGVCGATGVPYSVNNIAGVTYNWSNNNVNFAVAGGQGTSSITGNFNPGYVSGALSVTPSNGCGVGTQRNRIINSTPAKPIEITGAATVCANQSGVAYSIAPVATATNYTWGAPAGSHINDGSVTSTGATLVTTATNVTINFGSTSGNVKVRANNACGNGTYKTLAVSFTCREANNTSSFDVNIFPNPAEDEMNISFNSITQSSYSIKVNDIIGNTLLMNTGVAEKGENSFKLSLEEINSGVYLVEIKNEDISRVLKLVVN